MLTTLTEARRDAGMTVRELSRASGVPARTIVGLETRLVTPARGSSDVLALALALEVPTASILFNDGRMLFAVDPNEAGGFVPYDYV